MQVDAPLASPWSTARKACLRTVVGAWVVFWANFFTLRIDWVADAALSLVAIAVVALVPVFVLGRTKLGRLHNEAKEIDRLRHLER